MRARCTRGRPGPDITLSEVTRSVARSRIGQIAHSSSPTGPKPIWQASEASGVWPLRPPRSDAPTPRPVPGPRMTWGPPRGRTPRPDGRAQPSRDRRQRQRLGLEIVEQQPLGQAEPARATSGPSISQGALVSLSVLPTTGPAPQAITDCGRAPSSSIAASIASARPDNPRSCDGRLAERRIGRSLYRETHIGAADVADQGRERHEEFGRGRL